MSDLFTLLPQADEERGPWVLVTLIEAQGSTYRKTGAHLLVNRAGEWLGMLSGGCLEAEVAARCGPVLQGEVEALEIHIDTRLLLGCDGRLILVAETVPSGLASQIAAVKETRRAATLYTHRPGPNWQPSGITSPSPHAVALTPPPRLWVFGAGPGVEPLLKMGHVLEWECRQLVLGSDPALRRRPDASWTILATAQSLTGLGVDQGTACVVMNHHVGRDTEIVAALWNTSTPFLGLVGSRRRRDELLERLAFVGDLQLESRILYTPVGLDLGGDGPADIALEICAQIQQVMTTSGFPIATGAP